MPAHHPASLLRTRHVLDQRRVLVDFEELLRRIDQEHDVVSGKSLLDVVGLLIDLDAAVGTDAAREGVPMNALKPAIRIDLIWYSREFGQGRKGHTRRLILARATLMRPFMVVMLHELLGDLSNFLQSGWPMDLQALLVVASMVPFNKCIFIWSLWWADVGVNAKTQEKSPQWRGKITATGAADPPGIMIKGESRRKAIGA